MQFSEKKNFFQDFPKQPFWSTLDGSMDRTTTHHFDLLLKLNISFFSACCKASSFLISLLLIPMLSTTNRSASSAILQRAMRPFRAFSLHSILKCFQATMFWWEALLRESLHHSHMIQLINDPMSTNWTTRSCLFTLAWIHVTSKNANNNKLARFLKQMSIHVPGKDS